MESETETKAWKLSFALVGGLSDGTPRHSKVTIGNSQSLQFSPDPLQFLAFFCKIKDEGISEGNCRDGCGLKYIKMDFWGI